MLTHRVTDELRRRVLGLTNRQIDRLQPSGRRSALQQAGKAREREFVQFGEVGIHERGFKAKSLFRLIKTLAKRRTVKHRATHNYRLEQLATALAAVSAAALCGWAIALALGLWGDAQMAKLPPWKPFALANPKIDVVPVVSAPSVVNSRLVGVAGDRAYFVTTSGAVARSFSLAAGDALPSGEKLLRVERDAVLLLAAGQESRVTVFGIRTDPAKKTVVTAAPAAVAGSGCRLTGSDRSAAIFIEPKLAKALTAERATFARMFTIEGSAPGIRAKGTGGTTAMFAIVDGDLLLRADGVPLKSSDAVITEVLARVERGNSVVLEGERNGAPRRWVYAPTSCATQPS